MSDRSDKIIAACLAGSLIPAHGSTRIETFVNKSLNSVLFTEILLYVTNLVRFLSSECVRVAKLQIAGMMDSREIVRVRGGRSEGETSLRLGKQNPRSSRLKSVVVDLSYT